MGLDNFAFCTFDVFVALSQHTFIHLVGDPYRGYIHGKAYNDVVEGSTGITLYQNYITPDYVKEISEKLAVYTSYEGISQEELQELQTFFKILAEHGAGLVGSW